MRRVKYEVVARAVGRRIAEIRKQAGLTQDAFSAQYGVSLRYLQNVEAGRENLTIETLVAFANELDVSVSTLFEPPSSTAPLRGRPLTGAPHPRRHGR